MLHSAATVHLIESLVEVAELIFGNVTIAILVKKAEQHLPTGGRVARAGKEIEGVSWVQTTALGARTQDKEIFVDPSPTPEEGKTLWLETFVQQRCYLVIPIYNSGHTQKRHSQT